MYFRVLVPFDGSELARGALQWAERLVAGKPAELFLLQVVQPLGGMLAARPTPSLIAAAKREEQREIRAATEALSNHLHALHGRGLSASRYVAVGNPTLKILEFVGQHGIDLIVMGTHGRGGVPRALLGSVADEVRRQAAVPVLLIRGEGAPPVGEQSVLICLDQSPEAESALESGINLATGLGGAVVLFEVAEGPRESSSALVYLQRKAEGLQWSGPQVSTVTGQGDPGPAILLQAQIMQASVIVMASHGRTGVARAVLGSVASHVVGHSRVPVLLTHRQGVSERQRGLAAAQVSANPQA